MKFLRQVEFLRGIRCDLIQGYVYYKPMPQEEYDFWQPQIARVLAEHPADAELYAAAAVMMDKPTDWLDSTHWQLLNHSHSPSEPQN